MPRRASGRVLWVLAISAAFAMGPALASAGSESGTITPNWYVYGDGTLFFYLDGTKTGPDCSIPERWAIDTTSATGKSFFAVFLAAAMAGRAVVAHGNMSCAHGNSEYVFQLHVQ